MLKALSITAIALAVPTTAARAASVPCGPVDRGVIQIDGLLEDWTDVPGLDIGGQDRDFSFTARCNYEADTLYLVVDVRDDTLARTRQGGRTRGKQASPEDHVEIAFADGTKVDRLVVFPGDPQTNVPRQAYFTSGRPVRDVQVADSLQMKGWAVELALPRARVPGWTAGAPSLRLAVGAWDSDSRTRPAIKHTLTSSPMGSASQLGTIEFAESRQLFEALLRDRKLRPSDIVFDRVGHVLGTGRGRVVLGGRTLAFIGDEYAYIDLPVRSPRDIFEVKLVDLAGDGREAALVRYRESGGGGYRDVLAAYRLSADGLRRVFGVEIGKGQGGNRLQCRISFVSRKRATDIVIEPLPAVGWTEATFHEAPAEDIAPILLPWSGDKRARFQFHGDEYNRAE